MLLVIAGAGASFDSISSRPISTSSYEEHRPPVADNLFSPRPAFEDIQRLIPQVRQVATLLHHRANGESVEDVLARFSGEATHNARRPVQLAAVRFYLQGVIARCEERWYREHPVSTNMDALYDQIENARHERTHALFVTFNYDRLIEHALENSGQHFSSLDDYIARGRTRVIKLHGSVDWVRPIKPMDTREFGGSGWTVARQVSDAILSLPEPGAIEIGGDVPSSSTRNRIAIPAIAIPVKAKDRFECPDSHVTALREALPEVRAILTVGWRAGEQYFLKELSQGIRHQTEVTCVTGNTADSDATIAALRHCIPGANFERYGAGFSQFIRDRRVERLLNIAWER